MEDLSRSALETSALSGGEKSLNSVLIHYLSRDSSPPLAGACRLPGFGMTLQRWKKSNPELTFFNGVIAKVRGKQNPFAYYP